MGSRKTSIPPDGSRSLHFPRRFKDLAMKMRLFEGGKRKGAHRKSRREMLLVGVIQLAEK